MKRWQMTWCLARTRLASHVGLAVISLAAPGYAGWNPFSTGSPLEVGPQPGQIEIADFNGDGHADILANHPLHGRASLLVGDGQGNFAMSGRSVITFGYDPAAIAVGDVNGDNRLDLAVASRDGSTERVHILLGDPKAGFQEIAEAGFASGKISEKGWKPSLTLADVNGDKKLDLIAADGRRSTVEVFYGRGGGQFAPGQTIALDEGFDRYSLISGDVNGDRKLDLVVACAMAEGDEPGRILVKLGGDKGGLVDAPELTAAAPAGAFARTLCDINRDKRTDIVLTHGKMASVFAQGVDGKFAQAAGSPFEMANEAFGVTAVDVGMEKLGDILVAATVDGLDVVFANEEGRFGHACHTPMPAGKGTYQIAQGDINGDGKLDVVANNFEGDELSVLLGN